MNGQQDESKSSNRDPIQLLNMINAKEKRILRLQSKNTMYWIATIVLFFILVIMFAFREISHQRTLAKTITDFTYVKEGLSIGDTGIEERRRRFEKMMMQVFYVYSHTYRYERKPKAMNNTEKVRYLRLCFDAATAIDIGLYDVPTIQLFESNFNPNCIGFLLNEMGMGQLTKQTFYLAESIARKLPDNLKRIIGFQLSSEADMLDPIINTKATFVMLWWYKKLYRNQEEFYISLYHWGGWLAKYAVKGYIPEYFTFDGERRYVLEYYLKWKMYKTAFEKGSVEVGKQYEDRYKKQKREREEEIIQYSEMRRMIKNLKRENARNKILISELKSQATKYDKLIKETDTQLRSIFITARKQNTKTKIIKEFKKVKGVAKEFVDKIEKSEKERGHLKLIIIIVLFCLFILFSIYIYIKGFIDLLKRIKKRFIKRMQ